MKATIKKVLSMGLAIVLTAGIAISGTVAYFTDTDEAINTLTVGNVEVELFEKQRNEDKSDLEDFEDGSVLYPIVDGEKDTTFQMNGGANYVDKIVYATNTGDSDAYMRILIAIPTWANVDGTAANNNLHWNIANATSAAGTAIIEWMESKDMVVSDASYVLGGGADYEVTIDGQKYNVWSFTFNEVIEPGENTIPTMTGMYLDKRVDYNPETGMYIGTDGVEFEIPGGVVNIPVMVQAVQAAGFEDVAAAFAAAEFPENPWAETVMPTVISNATELKNVIEAAKSGETVSVVLSKDITLETSITAASGVNVVVDGGNHTITASNMTNDTVLRTYGGVVELSNLTITGDAKCAFYNQGGNVTMDNVAVQMNGNYVVNLFGGGKVVMNDCTVDGTADFVGVWFGDGRTVTINGGEYNSMCINASKGAGVGSAGKLTVNDATIGLVYIGKYENTTATLINNGSTISEIVVEGEN